MHDMHDYDGITERPLYVSCRHWLEKAHVRMHQRYNRYLMSTVRPRAKQMGICLMLLMSYAMCNSTSRAFWCF